MVCGTSLRKGFLSLALLAFMIVPVSAQGLRLGLLGGVDFHPAQGSKGDYVPGVNDFPLTRSHSSWLAGFSLWQEGDAPFRLGLLGLYHNGGSVALEDPGDGDVVTMDARSHLTAHACLGLTWLRTDLLRMTVLGGVGGTLALAQKEAEELVTEQGELLLVENPPGRLGFSGVAGVEGLWRLGRSWGLVTAAYVSYHKPLENHWVVSGMVGLSWVL